MSAGAQHQVPELSLDPPVWHRRVGDSMEETQPGQVEDRSVQAIGPGSAQGFPDLWPQVERAG
jgi:hypothetical protein